MCVCVCHSPFWLKTLELPQGDRSRALAGFRSSGAAPKVLAPQHLSGCELTCVVAARTLRCRRLRRKWAKSCPTAVPLAIVFSNYMEAFMPAMKEDLHLVMQEESKQRIEGQMLVKTPLGRPSKQICRRRRLKHGRDRQWRHRMEAGFVAKVLRKTAT